MSKMPDIRHPTIAAIAAAMEAAQESGPRSYLGMSQIGHPCERHLWYSLRWVGMRRIEATGLRAIEDGYLGEEVMAKRLKLVKGIELHTLDAQGQQFGLTAIAGHLRGHMDGAILGVLEAPKTWHVWEHKQVNSDKFKKLHKLVDEHGEKAALAKWDEVYFGQAQAYMGLSGMDRHFLTVGSPGGRDYISVRTEFDQAVFDGLLTKARRIIEAKEPPQRLSEDPAFYLCKWCHLHSQCHGEALPEVNCRTCAHSTPSMTEDTGRWHCALEDVALDTPTQRDGCNGHRYIPILMSRVAKQVDATEEEGGNFAVKYELTDGSTFSNGYPPNYSSKEIRAAKHLQMLDDEQVKQVKTMFKTAEVVG